MLTQNCIRDHNNIIIYDTCTHTWVGDTVLRSALIAKLK